MKISILEQSPLPEEGSACDAVRGTVKVAEEADRLGFERVWLSEHHNMPVLQGSAPELLLAAIGARTSRIRLGTGGVMLPNHSPYRVAENFRTLEALYPGRIDCGIGRASGGDAYSRSLLRTDGGMGQAFPDQLAQLERYLHDECQRALAIPTVRSTPPMWLLSIASSPESGRLAAEKGMGLAVALFIDPNADARAVETYRRHFRPSEHFSEPRVLIALNVITARDPETLAEMKLTSDVFRLARDNGNYLTEIPSPETLRQIRLNPAQVGYLRQISNREVIGLPEDAARELRERAAAYDADEIMVTAMTHSVDRKLEILQTVAETMIR